MSIDLKQFAGSAVAPVDDARLYNFILSGKTGIVEGVEVTHLGANQLKVSAGWGVCCGRMFSVEEETINAVVSPDGEITGRLLINIDVSADVPATFVTQAAATLPALVQENINSSGTVYQFSLAEYTVDSLQCSNLVDKRIFLVTTEISVQAAQSTADTAKSTADTHIANKSNPHGVTASQVGLGNVTNNKQMPIAGGTFTGNAIAYSTNRNSACLRNITVTNSSGTAQSTNRIIMYRK